MNTVHTPVMCGLSCPLNPLSEPDSGFRGHDRPQITDIWVLIVDLEDMIDTHYWCVDVARMVPAYNLTDYIYFLNDTLE